MKIVICQSWLTELFVDAAVRRINVHEGLREAQADLGTLQVLFTAILLLMQYVGKAEASRAGEGVHPSELTYDELRRPDPGALRCATKVMADIEDADDLLRIMEDVPGLRQLDPFWYKVSVCMSLLLV